MWADDEPLDPTPTIDQAINDGYPWLQIECSRCKTPRDVDMTALAHPYDLRARPGRPAALREVQEAGKWPVATLLQVAPRARHVSSE